MKHLLALFLLALPASSQNLKVLDLRETYAPGEVVAGITVYSEMPPIPRLVRMNDMAG